MNMYILSSVGGYGGYYVVVLFLHSRRIKRPQGCHAFPERVLAKLAIHFVGKCKALHTLNSVELYRHESTYLTAPPELLV